MKPFLTYLLVLGIVLISLMAWLTSLYGWIFPIELLSHFQVQYVILSLLLFGLLILTRHKRLLFIAILAVTITSINVVNWYLPLIQNQPREKANLEILIYNVKAKNRHYKQALAMIREEEPNIAIFLEVNEIWMKQIQKLNDQFSYLLRPNSIDDRGIVIYSQLPLNNPSTNLYGNSDKLILSADLKINNQGIHLIATHPAMPLYSFEGRNKELAQMSHYIQSLDRPVIVAGDLNITMWSPYYRRFVNQTGLKNTRQGFGILPTWPAKSIHPVIANGLSIPIDHCLTTPDIQVKQIHLGDNAGSDHFPLITDLFIPAT